MIEITQNKKLGSYLGVGVFTGDEGFFAGEFLADFDSVVPIVMISASRSQQTAL